PLPQIPLPPLPPPPSSLHLPPPIATSLPLPLSPLPSLQTSLFILPPVYRMEDIPEAELPLEVIERIMGLSALCVTQIGSQRNKGPGRVTS
ncbi:hypothetical protein Tco_0552525, partial [Tanacetum coccineum]